MKESTSQMKPVFNDEVRKRLQEYEANRRQVLSDLTRIDQLIFKLSCIK